MEHCIAHCSCCCCFASSHVYRGNLAMACTPTMNAHSTGIRSCVSTGVQEWVQLMWPILHDLLQ